ncbi:hypothetical protein [Jannaschia sp. CCS1]|uniref:hypothetical protein n=1 Tax=Jannaschia sp. (strain CCS1) TaxID=290400 RepID=UPI000053D3B7|nr:hypothetical protein [Jannaschia sp. CCS1]ABD57017.1 hypothetical protein Jann_4100 [Jannaschia sp. CCS1]
MNLLYLDANTVEGKYMSAVGDGFGTPHFINLDQVVWGYLNRGSFSLILTMVTGGTWELTYSDRAAYHRVTRLFIDNAYNPKEG